MDDLEAFLVRQERDLRREVTQRVFHDAHARMTLSNMRAWNTDGFYAARSPDELIEGGIAVDDFERTFPVPADCAQWCNAQRVMGVVQRAFVRRAWMDVPNEGQGSTLLLVVSEAAISDWIDKVVVFSGMERMYLAGHEQKEGGAYLFWQMQGASLDSRLTIECATLGESELWGRFSIAVTMPTWV